MSQEIYFKVILNSIQGNSRDSQDVIAYLLSRIFQVSLAEVQKVIQHLPVIILDNMKMQDLALLKDNLIFLSKFGLEYSISANAVNCPQVKWNIRACLPVVACPHCGEMFYLMSAQSKHSMTNSEEQTVSSVDAMSALQHDQVLISQREINTALQSKAVPKMPTAMVDMREVWNASRAKNPENTTPTTQNTSASAPTQRPVATPAPTQRPVATPAPAQRPVATPAPTQRPVATPAPSQRPVATPAPSQRPVATPAPAQRPVATPAPTQRPVATSAPTQRPVATPAPAMSKSMGTPKPAENKKNDSNWEELGSISSHFEDIDVLSAELQDIDKLASNNMNDFEELEEVGSISEELDTYTNVSEELEELEGLTSKKPAKSGHDNFDIEGIGGISAEFEEIAGVSAEFEKICMEGMDNDIGSLSAEFEEIDGASSEFDDVDLEEGLEKIKEISEDFHQPRMQNNENDSDNAKLESSKNSSPRWEAGNWKLLVNFAGRGNLNAAAQFLAEIQQKTLEEALELAKTRAAVTIISGVSYDVADKLLKEFQKLGMSGKVISV